MFTLSKTKFLPALGLFGGFYFYMEAIDQMISLRASEMLDHCKAEGAASAADLS